MTFSSNIFMGASGQHKTDNFLTLFATRKKPQESMVGGAIKEPRCKQLLEETPR